MTPPRGALLAACEALLGVERLRGVAFATDLGAAVHTGGAERWAPWLDPAEGWEALVARGLLPGRWSCPGEFPLGRWCGRCCCREDDAPDERPCPSCDPRGSPWFDAPTLACLAAMGPGAVAAARELGELALRGDGLAAGADVRARAYPRRRLERLHWRDADPLFACDAAGVFHAEFAADRASAFDPAAMARVYAGLPAERTRDAWPALASLRAMGLHVAYRGGGLFGAGLILLGVELPWPTSLSEL